MLRKALSNILGKIITILQEYFLPKKKKATFFHEAHITLVPISDKANTRKKNYRSTSFRNLVAKIPNEF